jgi:hypothetical protein
MNGRLEQSTKGNAGKLEKEKYRITEKIIPLENSNFICPAVTVSFNPLSPELNPIC